MASSSRSHQHQEAELDGDHIASPLLPSTSGRSPERDEEEEGENSPIEQVALTVPVGDDPDTPVPTFRMWVLGVLSCAVLSFLNQFFWYRKEPLS